MTAEANEKEQIYFRLSDKILDALKLALVQKDVAISELLNRALEMAMTRGAGGRSFIERREFSTELEAALDAFEALKKESKGL
jgi:hypothetical protein